MRPFALRILVATTLMLALGYGCGSTGGCLAPLPANPGPHGLPPDQIIEGGLQARITKPGVDKLLGAIQGVFGGLLSGTCFPKQTLVDVLNQKGGVCDANECAGGAQGCPVRLYLDSSQRPPPANQQDHKLGVAIALNDSPPAQNPRVTVDAKLDVWVPLRIWWDTLIDDGFCHLDVYDSHLRNNDADPIHVIAQIDLGTSPATGELTLGLADLRIPNLGLTTSGCSVISFLANAVLGLVNGVLSTFIGDFILDLLRPVLNDLLQSLLPKPLGIAGTFNAGSLLASFNPPKDASLEMFVVAGGYVQSKAGGLTLGVMSGVNSDRDQKTRAPGLTSEPSLCVPLRRTPDLAKPPWMLPVQPMRKDFTLNPAGPFAGNPEPVSMGKLQDVAIGVSRTFMDLAGFHIYNSGTLCLTVGGSVIPQLTAGTLSVIVGSLGDILEDKKAPLALQLRPQMPITFTVGEGTMLDPLVHVGIKDMRIDFYAWMEERYVRLLTVALDMNAGVNLNVTKTPAGEAAIEPVLVGVDAANVSIRISNTDLLAESPKDLEQLFPTLVNIAIGALGGAIKPIALPSVAGFSLDEISLARVQTAQDDFLGIFGAIKTAAPALLVDRSDPLHPRSVGELRTRAQVEAVLVPTQDELRALFLNGAAKLVRDEERPRVTLRLDADNPQGRPVEWGWRINGGMWRPWTREARPVIADDVFLLQGRHRIEVRSRVVDDSATEDMTPERIDVLIDSVAPELHPSLAGAEVTLGGFDIVSDRAALEYQWGAPGSGTTGGEDAPWVRVEAIPLAEVRRLTHEGARPMVVKVRDEAGNIGEGVVDLNALSGFHGRTTQPASGGCSCEIGGAAARTPASETRGALTVALVLLLGLRVRLWRGWATQGTLAGALAIAVLGLYAAGCGCDQKNSCRIDDECAKMECRAGTIPQCISGECGCQPDVAPGDVGRFSSMAMLGGSAYVAAYNSSYGDLMIGHLTPPGVVANWEFVDGVPDGVPDVLGSHVRGGIQEKGDDVGRYTSIGINTRNEPIIAYYDKTHGSLKLAHFGVIRWRNHTVDKGQSGDEVGRWASMSVGADGKPAIAYTATVKLGTSGVPEGQLRVAQAKVNDPERPEDWTVTVVDSRPLSMSMAPDGGMAEPDPLLPEGIGLMPQLARRVDGAPGIVYYDRTRGNLRLVEFDGPAGKWGAPQILDGEDAMGNDLGDVGLYPSFAYDAMNVAHISYADATRDNLLYVTSRDKLPEVIDDGYRPGEEMTSDGIPSPVWHLVGDSSSLAWVGTKLIVAYQDSTALQLRVAERASSGPWMHSAIAGHAMPFSGAYGFYANLRASNLRGVISTYAINQQLENPLFFVEVFSIDLGIIM